ncbi:hypothetical protein NM688_g1045 [Phlebia brevispora]|uniref:Uncharacterized protein n=1 Tax=Phlebia brevispora TaxID=194682 RepID=A0ACC1TCA2_9APHY|nr:hypothetical protein NM688_g1045 [Phlebia brevispora]
MDTLLEMNMSDSQIQNTTCTPVLRRSPRNASKLATKVEVATTVTKTKTRQVSTKTTVRTSRKVIRRTTPRVQGIGKGRDVADEATALLDLGNESLQKQLEDAPTDYAQVCHLTDQELRSLRAENDRLKNIAAERMEELIQMSKLLEERAAEVAIAEGQLKDVVDGILERLECAICSTLMTRPYKLECGHVFCCKCLKTWFSQSSFFPNCPNCRDVILDDPKPSHIVKDLLAFVFANSPDIASDTDLQPESDIDAEGEFYNEQFYVCVKAWLAGTSM